MIPQPEKIPGYLAVAADAWETFDAEVICGSATNLPWFARVCAETYPQALQQGFSGDITQWEKEVHAAGWRGKP